MAALTCVKRQIGYGICPFTQECCMQFPVGITQAAVLYKTSYAGQYGKQESESQSAQAPAQFVPRRFPYEAQQPAYWPGHAFSETTQSGDGEETPRAEQAQRAVPHQDAAQADPSGKTEAARMAASHRLPVLRGHLGDPHLPGAERLDEGGDQRVQRDDHPAVRQQRGAPPRPRVFFRRPSTTYYAASTIRTSSW